MDYEKMSRSLDKIEQGIDGNKKLLDQHGTQIDQVQKDTERLNTDLTRLRKQQLTASAAGGARMAGRVSDDCARNLAAQVILNLARKGKLEGFITDARSRDELYTEAKGVFGMEQRTALTTSDIPLPTQFTGQLRELISEFGVVRNKMFPYPMGGGTSKPPRMGTRPAFGSIAISAAFPEKSPTLTFASLEPHKLGGVVIMPREIEDQSIVQMGQFLARYGAIEFARAEDTWGFLADGTSTYENVKGVVQIATENSKYVQLGSTLTAPSDATLADFRLLRTKVNKAALSAKRSAYYLDSTWETRLPAFKTQADPYVYQRMPDGSAVLDGYPIVWTDVMTAYGVTAAANSPIAVFGALEFWWFGERGMPRVDTSADVLFIYDQLATRFIEEIDFDYNAVDAAAVLLTAAG